MYVIFLDSTFFKDHKSGYILWVCGLIQKLEFGFWGFVFFVVVGYDVTVYYLGFFFGYVFAVMKRFCWLNSTIFIYIYTHTYFFHFAFYFSGELLLLFFLKKFWLIMFRFFLKSIWSLYIMEGFPYLVEFFFEKFRYLLVKMAHFR